MTPRDVECPTCGAPAGSSCEAQKRRPLWTGTVPTVSHVARRRAARSAEGEREHREQMRDWQNDAGVD